MREGGVLLFVARFAYLATSFTSIVLPASMHAVSRIALPLAATELPMMIWLLVKGAKVPVAGAAV